MLNNVILIDIWMIYDWEVFDFVYFMISGKVIEQIKEKLLLSYQDLHTSKLEQGLWFITIDKFWKPLLVNFSITLI